ncbi:hypothetical protein C8R46DRAFT_516597 [Mycena filopes]|nr:hypothetical protein C8R46DRAFT_516597 [Mycena filopes]
MYLPVLHHLRATAESAIARLNAGAAILPEDVSKSIAAANAQLTMSDYMMPDDIIQASSQFTLAVLVGLLGVVPPRYHKRPYLLGMLGACTADSSFDKLARHIQIAPHGTSSPGSQLLATLYALFSPSLNHHQEAKYQTIVNAILAGVYGDIREACELLILRQEVLSEINGKNLDVPATDGLSLSVPTSEGFHNTPRFLLENLRRSSLGIAREELLKFKCGPSAAKIIAVGKQHKNPVNEDDAHRNKRAKTVDEEPKSHTEMKAQAAYVERKIRRARKEKQDRPKKPRASVAADLAALSGAASASESPGMPPVLRWGRPSTLFKAKPPIGKPVPLTIPKSQGVYPNTLEWELSMGIDKLILSPPGELRAEHFYVKVPQISASKWQSIPIDDPAKCEGLLLVGKYALAAAVSRSVYAMGFPAPLTQELVLSALLSDRALASILVYAGVFHEAKTVPAHFPAKAFQVYLGAVLMSGTMSLEAMIAWIYPIFAPISVWFRGYGIGDYHENRAALAAVGVLFAKK